jgi:hypothetical protein
VSGYVFEEIEETVEPGPAQLKPHPVVAVVAAAPRSGASTVARLLAAEMAARGDGAAVVVAPGSSRRGAPPSRAALRVATALTGLARAQAVGRLCLVAPGDGLVNAARYLAPVVIDLPADGSAAGVAGVAGRVVVVASGSGEPALLDAVAAVVGGDPVKVANRVVDPGDWANRADFVLPDSRLAARAAAVGTRALGGLGSAVDALASSVEGRR